MSRGRKKTTTNGLDWEGLFNKSRGVYFQFILSELGKKTDFSITNDTGAELLEKIKSEKDKLIKEKKIKQGKLQEAEVQSELVFNIPKNWIWCKLDDICLNITDGTHQTLIILNQEGHSFRHNMSNHFVFHHIITNLYLKKHIRNVLKIVNLNSEIF